MMNNQQRNHFQRPMTNYSVMSPRNASCGQTETASSCQQAQGRSTSNYQQTQNRAASNCQQTQNRTASNYQQTQNRATSNCQQTQNRATSNCQQSTSCPVSPCRPSGQMTREQLLKWISYTKFACVDVSLYLDTHPCDEEALSYFQEYNRLYNEAMDEYAKAYGPLTIAHARSCDTYWDWVNQPWPWQ